MPEVTIETMGSRWKVRRDGGTVGVYQTEEEARKAAEIARNADTWPPESGIAGIQFKAGKWCVDIGKTKRRTVSLDEAIRWKRAQGKPLKKETGKTRNAGCAKCVWRLVEQDGTAGKHWYCGYSLCSGHHSRVWLHYQRTGKESLEGMTHGTGCTEFMAGDPRDKLSLITDNPGSIQKKGWALLRKEGLLTQDKAKQSTARRQYALTVDLDMEKARELKSHFKWKEIANAAGLSINGAKSSWERQRINRQAAMRLLDAYGVDITKED